MSEQAAPPPSTVDASSSPPAAPLGVSVASTPTPSANVPEQPQNQKPITAEKTGFRKNWPEWAKQLPRLKFPPPAGDFQLISVERLREVLKDSDPGALRRVEQDLTFLDHELLRLFRERDHEAKMHQNRYRLYQIGYIMLAAFATLLGSLQALALNTQPRVMPWLAFFETVIALAATFLATISGREPPLPLYLNNRRRAESLRREYFRYIMNLSPYDSVEGPKRRMLLSARAADINRGVFPEEQN